MNNQTQTSVSQPSSWNQNLQRLSRSGDALDVHLIRTYKMSLATFQIANNPHLKNQKNPARTHHPNQLVLKKRLLRTSKEPG
jgi:hypothetical protein